MELFKLFGTIAINNDNAIKTLQSTDDAAKGTAGKIAGLGGQVDSLIQKYTGMSSKQTEAISGMTGINIKAVAVTAGIAAIGVAAVKAASDLVSSTSDMEDQIDKMSQKIGISAEAYQKLDYAFSMSGADVSVLQTGMKTLNDQIDSAASGNETAKASFEKLGVSITDSSGEMKSSETILQEVISALADMPDSAARSALSVDLLGKSATEMKPLLNEGSEGIKELTDRASELGLVMSDESVEAGATYNDTLEDVNRSFTALGSALGNELMPYFQSFYDWVLENMPTIQSIVSTVIDAITTAINFLQPVLDLLGTTISGLLDIVDFVMSGIDTIVSPVIQGVQDMINGLIDVINTLTLGLLDLDHITTARDASWDSWLSENKSKTSGLAGTSVENGDGTTTYYSKYYQGENANGGILTPGQFGTVGENGIELIHNVGGNAVVTPTSNKGTSGSNVFYVTVDASNIKELNDLVKVAREAKQVARMGIV